MFDGLVVMSGGHCTHPTGGPAIRLKHKKKKTNAFASSQYKCNKLQYQKTLANYI